MGWAPHGYTPGLFPLTELVEQPLNTHNASHSSAAYWRVWEEVLKPSGMQKEVVTLAMHVGSGGHFHMRDHMVKSLADLPGKRIRVPTPVVGRALARVGGESVNMQLRTVSQLMNTGAIDGTALVDSVAVSFGISRDTKAVTHVPGGLFANSFFLVMNKDKWNKISAEDQAAIRSISGAPLSRELGRLSHEAELVARKKLQESMGENYSIATPEFISDLKNLFAIEQENWKIEAEHLGVDGDQAIALFKRFVAEESSKQMMSKSREQVSFYSN